VLEGKPLEKQLESHAMGSQPGSIHGVLQAPYFYTAPETARVNAGDGNSRRIHFNSTRTRESITPT